MRKHKNKILTGVVIIIILTFVYWWGGNSPALRGWKVNQNEVIQDENIIRDNDDKISQQDETEAEIQKDSKSQETSDKIADNKPNTQSSAENVTHSNETATETKEETAKDQQKTDKGAEDKPVPIEPETVTITDKALTCTLSVRCDTVFQNITWLDEDKRALVPNDGVIFAERQVTFYEGESVFNLLSREMKKNKIHLEFVRTPIYNSAYIEGINNLYEFDCGELSGWMYKVNGWFPNYGCSRYQLKEGDKVQWVYTCNLGPDVGGYYGINQKDE